MERRRVNEDEARRRVVSNVSQLHDSLVVHGYDTRLAGSYGRAASISDGSRSAYSDEGENLRDIDITFVRSSNVPVPLKEVEKYANGNVIDQKVDVLCPNSFISDGNNASISYRDIELPVAPDVLRTFKGDLYGYDIPTFDPMTHFHLTLMFGYVRKKDFFNLLDFGRKMRGTTHLPDDLFEPFHQLSEMSIKRYPGARRIREMQTVYRAVFPQSVRKTLLPVVNPIANYLRRNI